MAGALKGNLRPTLSPLVGRTQDLYALRRALSRSRLVTVTGTGGVGKTRLALEAAREAASAHKDGAWVVELAPIDESDLVIATAAAALGVREQPDRDVLHSLLELVAGQQCLIVLDNCEHVGDAAARLCTALLDRTPGIRILATSREPLRLAGELVQPLGPLDLPDSAEAISTSGAVALFASRAQAINPSFRLDAANGPHVAAICRCLDGLPLAIELAAARVNAMTPLDILERLDQRLDLLRSSRRGEPERHQTLRATMEWSERQLDPDERRLLRRLAVFAGSFGLASVEAVCAPELRPGQALDLLCRLVDCSLVVLREETEGHGRYALLESIRLYAREKLRAAGEEEALDRLHANHRLARARSARPVDLEPEIDSHRAALLWASIHEPGLGVRLALALVRFWWQRRWLSEGLQRMQAALASYPARDWLRLHGLVAAGVLERARGHHQLALQLHRDAYSIAVELNDWRALGITGRHLGATELHGLNFKAGRVVLEEALATVSAHSREESESDAQENAAKEFALDPPIDPDVPVDSRRLLIGLYFELALLGIFEGQVVSAAASLDAAFDLMTTEEDAERSALMMARAHLELVAGRPDSAEPQLRALLAMTPPEEDRRVAVLLRMFARHAVDTGQPERALVLAGGLCAVLQAGDHVITPAGSAEFDSIVKRARSGLNERIAAASWRRGTSMDRKAAIRLALRESEPVAAEPGATGPLSRRERHVAVLVADGLTTREIGARLFISERTAEGHLEKIRNKLGFRSRSQIVAWAVAAGLTAGEKLPPRETGT